MNIAFRIERQLLVKVHDDLSRLHAFAHERVGFLACRPGRVQRGDLLLAQAYLPVADDDYENDTRVGAMLSSSAIRKALQYAYGNAAAMLHVHRHEHCGVPRFSRVDLTESAKFVPDFWKVRPGLPHGTLLLSRDSMTGLCWDAHTGAPKAIAELTVVGRPVSIFGRWWR